MNRIGHLTLLGVFCCTSLLAMSASASAADIEEQWAIARIHSATLKANINPLGEPTSCQAQYVSEDGFAGSGYGTAKTVPCEPEDLGSGTDTVVVSVPLSDLEIDTTYHYRFLAGGEPGADQTFTTFGFEGFDFEVLDPLGEPEAGAGSHPYRLIATARITSTEDRTNIKPGSEGLPSPTAMLKDLFNELPPGIAGSAVAAPPCRARVAEEQQCSGDSQVGRLWISYGNSIDAGPAPLFNVIPPRGTAARFVSSINVSTGAFIDASIRTGDDYGITAGSHNITQLANVYGVKVEMWGVPASPAHDSDRSCPLPVNGYGIGCASNAPEVPFLTMPTECAGPLTVTGLADAYASPGEWVEASAELPPVTGCNALEFEPQLEARPTTNVADSPTGLHVDLHVPQPPALEVSATPTLNCVPGPWSGGAGGFSYRWLRNGVPIPGAEESTYTQTGMDVGSAVQCEVEAVNGAGPGFATTRAFLARPILSPAPARLTSASTVQITSAVNPEDESLVLTCDRGSWHGVQVEFSYRWFRDGAVVPGETGSKYEIAPGAPFSVQCEVTGSSNGTSTDASVAYSEAFASDPPPESAPPGPVGGPLIEVEGGPGLAPANLRGAVVKLPPGLTVNPSSAAGLEGCSPDQFGLTTPVGTSPIHTTPGPADCPGASKIGTVEVETPLLDQTLPGAVYLAEPYENPFASLLAIYVAVHEPVSGVVIKLAGHVEIGSDGRLTTSFDENPQLPFEHFRLDFFGGARAPLVTPAVCGSYKTTSALTPWSSPESGPPATPSDSYEITGSPSGGACPTSAGQQPNAPSFEAGTELPLAGAFLPFVLRLKREDGSQRFRSLSVTPPPGLLGRLAGIPYCSDAALAAAAAKTGEEEQAAPSCPVASQVGDVDVAAGAGPAPYYVQGRAYLAGPYKGAPLSLAIVTPAVAGPYDLGTVVVRSTLAVHPYTTQITVNSDPIPSELEGIQLNVRSIAVKIDRPQFTLNPSNCEMTSVVGSLTSTLGNVLPLANRFQVGECGRLAFKPKLSFSLKGATKRSGHPSLTAWLTMPPGGANIARAQVALPRTQLLDQGNLDKVCTQPEIATASCPPRSIYGYAKAWSPLLDRPLEGPVFLGVGYGHTLPDLVAELNGQIRVLLNGKVDTNKAGGIRNTFEVVPDAPVSKFMLRLKGGKKYGLIENSTSLCRKVQRASARFVGQNGKVEVLNPKIRTSCKKRKKRKAQRSFSHARRNAQDTRR